MKPDREAIIAMAKKTSLYDYLAYAVSIYALEDFYNLAYDDGQRDERESLVKIFEKNPYEYQWIVDTIRARKNGE